MPHGDNHHVWIHPENTEIMINSNDGGANVSENGGKTWSTQRNQPTAQFYRVNVDNRFPYYVYGGQQDNSTVAIASRSFGNGIGWKDWHSVGGCESAYTAFDPDNPVLIYAGCYMGQISEWDARTKNVRNVMAYPTLPAALASRDIKYRFNWNAPIVSSHHARTTIYHASNILLKTEDQGVSWTEVSPDLTRDDDEKQGPVAVRSPTRGRAVRSTALSRTSLNHHTMRARSGPAATTVLFTSPETAERAGRTSPRPISVKRW